MAESTALQAKYKITKSDVVQTNTLSKGQKITQLEGTGTLKMNKIWEYPKVCVNLQTDVR